MALQNTYEVGNNDIPTVKRFPIGKNILTATRYDPHGFWRFSFERGAIPKMLQGDFSGEAKVEQAVKAYLATRLPTEDKE